jgi:hypothetical protein
LTKLRDQFRYYTHYCIHCVTSTEFIINASDTEVVLWSKSRNVEEEDLLFVLADLTDSEGSITVRNVRSLANFFCLLMRALTFVRVLNSQFYSVLFLF